MKTPLVKPLQLIVCSCLLLITCYMVDCYPLNTYQEFDPDDTVDNEYEYEVLNRMPGAKVLLPAPSQVNYQDESGVYSPISVRGKKTIKAGQFASFLSALSRERNAQSGGKHKGQRFGISK